MFLHKATALVFAALVSSMTLVGGGLSASGATTSCPEGATLIEESETSVICQVLVTSTDGSTTITVPAGVTRYSMMLIGGGGGGYVIINSGAGLVPKLDSVAASNGGDAGEVEVHSEDLSAEPSATESTLVVTVGRGGGGTNEVLPSNVCVSNIIASDTTVVTSGGVGAATNTASKGDDAERPTLTASPKWTQSSGDGAVESGTTVEQGYGDALIPGGAGYEEDTFDPITEALLALTPPDSDYVFSLWDTAVPRSGNWSDDIARGGNAGAPGVLITAFRGFGTGGAGYSFQGYVSKGPAGDGTFIMRYAFDPTFVPPIESGDGGDAGDGDDENALPETVSGIPSELLGIAIIAVGAGLLALRRRAIN